MSRAEPRQTQQSPVRIFGVNEAGQPINVSAWTVDVSRHGVRIRGVHEWSTPGETVGVRHGNEKARFKIMWLGNPGTPQAGQIGLYCVEAGKYIWGIAAPDEPARSAPRQTGSFQSTATVGQSAIGLAPMRAGSNDRRKAARYRASGGVKVTEVGKHVAQWATLHDLSMGGCYVETSTPLAPGTPVEVMVSVGDIQIAARGGVTVSHPLVGMGVQFKEISGLNRNRLDTVMTTLQATSTEA